MKNRTTLFFVEQLVMLLVFAMAAAVCIGIFSASSRIRQQALDQDRAVFLTQTAAELLKSCSGDLDALEEITGGTCDANRLTVFCSHTLQQDPDGIYQLVIQKISGETPMVGTAAITVARREEPGRILFSVETAWQEVSP